MWVGDEVVVGVGWGCERKENGEMHKTCFLVGYSWYTLYVHYFKDIRQGVLQCYCV